MLISPAPRRILLAEQPGDGRVKLGIFGEAQFTQDAQILEDKGSSFLPAQQIYMIHGQCVAQKPLLTPGEVVLSVYTRMRSGFVLIEVVSFLPSAKWK